MGPRPYVPKRISRRVLIRRELRDADAIRSDWEAVGRDMRKAMEGITDEPVAGGG